VAPAGPVQEAIARIWGQVLGLDQVGAEDNFFELGGDSLLSIRVVSLAARLGIQITPRMMFQHQSIAQITDHIANDPDGVPETAGHWAISPLNESTSNRTIFCFPVMAGDLTGYVPLARALNTDARVLGLHLSWWDKPDEMEWNVQEIAQVCYSAIKSTQPNGPYLLVGWSFGGVLAMETARLLDSHSDVVRIIALDTTMPDAEYRDRELEDHLVDDLLAYLCSHRADAAAGHNLPDDVRSKLKALNIPEEMYALDSDDLIRRLYIMRGHRSAVLAYRPSPVDYHVTLYETEVVRPKSIREAWKIFARDLCVRDIPGDHHSFLRHPIVHALADGVREEIHDNDVIEERLL
jgi:thioesterase domain-containing protein/acyl carrier protein